MKWSEWIEKNWNLPKEKKEKIMIFFLIGLFFLLIATPVSTFSGENKKAEEEKDTLGAGKITESSSHDAYVNGLENKLVQTIEGMEGAGKVFVMITLKDNGEKILDKNQPYESENEKSKEEGKDTEHTNLKSSPETVLISKEGDTVPIVIQERYPEIEGVVVVCEGGDDTALVLRIKEAVQALFSIDAHKIVVCKSKS